MPVLPQKNRYGKGGTMRSLKFRAWNGKVKEFAYFHAGVDAYEMFRRRWADVDGELDDSEVCYDFEQYTGLTDKKGKEIYEGDIIKAKIDGLWQTGAHTVSKGKATWNLEVVYNDIRYMDVFHILGSKNQPDRIYYLFDEQISDLEIIGNVHENPELIGGEE